MNIPELLQQAIKQHQAQQLSEAETLYRQVLSLDATQFDAWHLLGLIAKQRGELETALQLLGKARSINDQHAILHNNLGTVLHALGRSEDALACYDYALTLQSDYAMAWTNRGNALRSLGHYPNALASYEQALQIQTSSEPWLQRGLCWQAMQDDEAALADFLEARALASNQAQQHDIDFAMAVSLHRLRRYPEALRHYEAAQQTCAANAALRYAAIASNRGMVLARLQRYAEAIPCFDESLMARPHHAHSLLQLGHSHQQCGQLAQAVIAYQEALQYSQNDQEREQAQFLLASLGQAEMPLTAPSAYLQTLFDQYAEHFDQHLQERLHYRVPALLAQAMTRYLPQTTGKPWDSLDLGCGTGLCGPWLSSFSRHLTGVDLSPKMLALAADTACYQDLQCEELLAFLKRIQDRETKAFHLIVAADVLVYFAHLDAVFERVQACLHEHAYFAFSVEQSSEQAIQLQRHQRYAHSIAYLQEIAHQHHFEIKEMQEQVGRQEQGQAVASLIVVLQKRSAARPLGTPK